jgi:hypothetical protein
LKVRANEWSRLIAQMEMKPHRWMVRANDHDAPNAKSRFVFELHRITEPTRFECQPAASRMPGKIFR